MAQPALDQINAAYDLFEKAAQYQEPNGRPAKTFVCPYCCVLLSLLLITNTFKAIITRLRYRAHQAFTRLHSGKHSLPPETSENPDDEELHILGGQTRIVEGRASSSPSTGNSTQSPASASSPDGQYRSSPKNNGHRGFTPDTLDKAHPSLLADLQTTKDLPPVNPSPYLVEQCHVGGSLEGQGYYPQSTTGDQQSPMTNIRQSVPQTQPIINSQWNNAPPLQLHPQTSYPSGYVPAPDTQTDFGLMGGGSDWDNSWHSFMDHLGMFSNDPNAPSPYATAPAQMKMER